MAMETKTRKSISDHDILSQSVRIQKLLSQCGDSERQRAILKLLESSLAS